MHAYTIRCANLGGWNVGGGRNDLDVAIQVPDPPVVPDRPRARGPKPDRNADPAPAQQPGYFAVRVMQPAGFLKTNDNT